MFISFKLVNLFTICTAALVAVNAIAVQYVHRTDPIHSSLISCTSDDRTAFSNLWFF